MNKRTEPELVFICNFDAQTEFEVEQKGWFEGAAVRLPNDILIPVSFWDPVRLAQQLEYDIKNGQSCLADPCMIIIPTITKEHMVGAVKQLFADKYFDRLLSLRDSQQNV